MYLLQESKTVTERDSSQKSAKPPLRPSLQTPWKPFRPSLHLSFSTLFDACLVSQRKTSLGLLAFERATTSRTVRRFPPPRQFHAKIFIASGGPSRGRPPISLLIQLPLTSLPVCCCCYL